MITVPRTHLWCGMLHKMPGLPRPYTVSLSLKRSAHGTPLPLARCLDLQFNGWTMAAFTIQAHTNMFKDNIAVAVRINALVSFPRGRLSSLLEVTNPVESIIFKY